MKVAPLSVVTLEYTVTDEHGEVIDTTVGKEPLVYLHGTRYLVSGLEAELEGRSVGEAFDVTLTPEQAYGQYDENLVQEVPGELFDGMEVSEGDTFVAETDDGHRPVTVIEVSEEFVKVDGNHPLAGVTLGFKVEIRTCAPPLPKSWPTATFTVPVVAVTIMATTMITTTVMSTAVAAVVAITATITVMTTATTTVTAAAAVVAVAVARAISTDHGIADDKNPRLARVFMAGTHQ